MDWRRVPLHLLLLLDDIISIPRLTCASNIFAVPNYSPAICCLLGWGGWVGVEQQRPAQAGVTLKIATGHLYWLQTER